MIWQIISCAILQNQGRLTNIYVRAGGLHVVWLCLIFSTAIKNYPLEIQSPILILQYLTKKLERILVIHDALITNLATGCGGILSETYIWTISGYKSPSSKLLLLEQAINGNPARTEQVGLGILVQLKINSILNDTKTHCHKVQHFWFLTCNLVLTKTWIHSFYSSYASSIGWSSKFHV